MSKYFKYFPKTVYQFANSSFEMQKVATNISLKTIISDGLSQDDPYLYYRYTVEEGERPEDVANFYYDSPSYFWLVLFSNDIVDPYTQWPMSYVNFTNYFRKKYSADANTTDPIEWGQNTLIGDNIVHYKYTSNTDHLISKDTYTYAQTFDGDFVTGDWTAVRYFEYELALNEANRSVVLLNYEYKEKARDNLERLLNE